MQAIGQTPVPLDLTHAGKLEKNPRSRAAAEEIASQFEAIFVKQIVEKMREGADLMGDGSMFGSGPGSDTYATWFDTYMSEHIAGTGSVGVADSLMRQLDDLGQVDPAEEPGEQADFDITKEIRR